VGTALGVGEDAAQKLVAGALEKLSQFFQRRGYRTATVAASGVMAAAGTVLLLRFEPALAALAAPLAPLAAVTPELGYATAAVLVSLGLGFLPRLLVRP
jgi:hypothetical protein